MFTASGVCSKSCIQYNSGAQFPNKVAFVLFHTKGVHIHNRVYAMAMDKDVDDPVVALARISSMDGNNGLERIIGEG